MVMIQLENGNLADADEVMNNLEYVSGAVINNQIYGDSVINGCEVTEQGSPNQTVAVGSGIILIDGYHYSIDANASVSLTVADATNPRYDIISVDKTGLITVTDGTAAATPVVPTLPALNSPLATIYRASNDNVINVADITDCRRLIDISYYAENNTKGTITTSSYGAVKNIIVPAFRCQKELELNFNLTYYSTDIFNPALTTKASTIGLKIYINGVDTTTYIQNARVHKQSTDNIMQWIESSTYRKMLTGDDVDFTQPIRIDIYLKGETHMYDTNYNLHAVNNAFSIKGK